MRTLIVDAEFAEPVRDGGARALADLRRALFELGHEVAIVHPDSLPSGRWDAVFASRPMTAARLRNEARRRCDGPMIFLGHDLHHRRLAMLAQQGEGPPGAAAAMLSVERVCWRGYDVSAYPNADEVAVVSDAGARGVWFPYFRIEPVGRGREAHETRGRRRSADVPTTLVFVGGARHRPNVTGLRWFGQEVLPELRRDAGPVVAAVAGEWPESVREEFEALGLTFLGALPEQELSASVAGADAVIVPLCAGAGMKSKTIAGLGSGVPVIATSVGLQGIPQAQAVAFRADTVDEWVGALRTVRTSPETVARTTEAACRFVAATYGSRAYLSAVAGLVAGDWAG